jgi:hypothetical protein
MAENPFNEQALIAEFIAALDAMPEVNAFALESQLIGENGAKADALVELYVNNQAHLLLVEAKKQVFPRDVREIVWQTERFRKGVRDDSIAKALPVVVAEALSPGARDLLQEQKVGYYDRGESLFLPLAGAFILIDRPAPKQMKKEHLAVFKGARARVLKVLFSLGHEWTNVKQVSLLARVSAATASKTLQELQRREWVEVEGSGPAKLRRLARPKEILDAWSEYQATERPPALRRYYVPVGTSEDLVRALEAQFAAHSDLRFAFTGEIAAQALAPHLTAISTVHCRVAGQNSEHEALAALDARPVTEGWNLALIDTSPNDFIGTTVTQGMRIASPLQIYLDLFLARGRAKELAAEFRARVLGLT